MTGRLHEGTFPELESLLLQRIRERQRADVLRPVAVAAGSNPLCRHLSLRLAETYGASAAGPAAHANVRFLTLLDLARQLAWLQPEGALPDAPAGAERLALLSQWPAAPELVGGPGAPGALAALQATLADLVAGGVSPALLRRTAAVAGGRHWGEASRLESLAAVYTAYSDSLAAYRRPADLMQAAAGGAAGFSRIFGCRELFVYGFYDLNACQQRLLAALARAVRLEVFLPHGPDTGWAFARALKRWFIAQGLKGDGPPPTAPPGDRRDAAGPPVGGGILARVQRRLSGREEGWRRGLAPPATATPPGDRSDTSFAVVAARTPRHEAREICRRMLQLTRRGVPPGRMAVLLVDAATYLPLLRETLTSAGIPCHCRPRPALASSGPGRLLSLYVRVFGDGFDSAAIAALAETVLPEVHGGIAAARVAALAGPAAGPEDWIGRLRRLAAREDRPTVARTAAMLLDRLAPHGRPPCPPPRGDTATYAAAARDFVLRHAPPGRERTAVIDRLDEAAGLRCTSGPITPAIFAALVEHLLEEELEDDGLEAGQRLRSVTVAGLLPFRGLWYDAIFLPGLNRGRLGGQTPGDTLLPDRARARLNRLWRGKARLPLRSARRLEERLLFALAVGSARRHLWLSYPRHEGPGGELSPSGPLLDAASAAAGRRVTPLTLEREPFFRSLPDPQGPTDPVIDEVEGWLDPQASPEQARRRYPFPFAGAACLQGRERGQPGPAQGMLPAGAVDPTRLFSPSGLAVTALEQYAACPFAFFAARLLDLAAPPRPEPVPGPARKGALVHRLLQRFYHTLQAADGLPLDPRRRDEYAALLRRLLDEATAALEEQGYAALPVPFAVWCRELAEDLQGFLDAELADAAGRGRGLIPTHLEHPVEHRADTEGESPALRGRIDRVDLAADGRLRLVDYKTGKARYRDDDLAGGRALQLPVYLAALAPSGAAADWRKAWAEYYSIDREADYRRARFPARPPEALADLVRRAVEAFLRAARAGCFCPAPADRGRCLTCDYARLCGTSTVARAGDLPVQRLREVSP